MVHFSLHAYVHVHVRLRVLCCVCKVANTRRCENLQLTARFPSPSFMTSTSPPPLLQITAPYVTAWYGMARHVMS